MYLLKTDLIILSEKKGFKGAESKESIKKR